MCIHVSEAVVDRYPVKDQFVCLGERQIKGKGIMVTSLYKVTPAEKLVMTCIVSSVYLCGTSVACAEVAFLCSLYVSIQLGSLLQGDTLVVLCTWTEHCAV